MVDKKPIGLRVAPTTLAMVEDLVEWLGAPSKAYIWETSIARWHGEVAAERRRKAEEGDIGEE